MRDYFVMPDYFVVTLPLMALGHPVPTLLPEGEGSKSPLPLGEGWGEGGTYSFHDVRSLCDSI